MQISSRILKAALWQVWIPISALQAPNLRAVLQAQAAAQITITSAGTIRSTTANGQTTEFSGFGPGVITQSQFVEVWVYLVDEYDRANSELPAGATDVQIETQMEANLRPIVNTTDNWMYIAK